MATPSLKLKYRDFIREPMGAKRVDAVDGIDERLALQLKKKGYYYAKQLLDEHQKQDDDVFKGWLGKLDATPEEQEQCIFCLKRWMKFHKEVRGDIVLDLKD